jgi:hypothetical protein
MGNGTSVDSSHDPIFTYNALQWQCQSARLLCTLSFTETYGKHAMFPIVFGKLGTLRCYKRLRKWKLGTLSCHFVPTTSLTSIWLLATKQYGYTWKILINPGRSIFRCNFACAIEWYHLSLGHIWHHRQIDNMSMIFYHAQPRKVVEAVFMPGAHVSTWCPLTLCHDIQLVSNEPRWHHIKLRNTVDAVRQQYKNVLWGHRNRTCDVLRVINYWHGFIRTLWNLFAWTNALHTTSVNTCIARYPRPVSCVYDQEEEESIGWTINARKACYSTSSKRLLKTPQANAVCERSNRPLATAFGSFVKDSPAGVDDAKQLVNTALAKAMYTMHTSFHSLEQWLPIATWLYHLLPILIWSENIR